MVPQVLVVDDDAAIRSLITEVLVEEGFAVANAVNGRQALDQIADHLPGLVLLDLQMPVMSGWEALAALQTAQVGTRRADVGRRTGPAGGRATPRGRLSSQTV